MISIPVDATLEGQAALVLDCFGVTAETAVRLLFVHLAEQGALPDSLKVPNVATQKALADADAMMAQQRRARSPMSTSGVGMGDAHDNGEQNDDVDDGEHESSWRSAAPGGLKMSNDPDQFDPWGRPFIAVQHC